MVTLGGWVFLMSEVPLKGLFLTNEWTGRGLCLFCVHLRETVHMHKHICFLNLKPQLLNPEP